jgi:hypothetical protein
VWEKGLGKVERKGAKGVKTSHKDIDSCGKIEPSQFETASGDGDRRDTLSCLAVRVPN